MLEENIIVNRNVGQPQEWSKTLSKQLDKIILELDRSFTPSLFQELYSNDLKETLDCLEKAKVLKSKVVKIHSCLNKYKTTLEIGVSSPYVWICNTCDEVVNVLSNKDLWSSFQEHEHIESAYVDYLMNKDKVTEIQPVSNKSEKKISLFEVNNPANAFDEVDDKCLNMANSILHEQRNLMNTCLTSDVRAVRFFNAPQRRIGMNQNSTSQAVVVNVLSNKDLWSTFQEQEHIESVYVDYLMNKDKVTEIQPVSNKREKKISRFEGNNPTNAFDEVDNKCLDKANSILHEQRNLMNTCLTSDFRAVRFYNAPKRRIGMNQNSTSQAVDPIIIPSRKPKDELANKPKPGGSNCSESIFVASGNDFKFCFAVDYDHVVKSELYPSNVLGNISGAKINDKYVIQFVAESTFRCLTCICLIPTNVSKAQQLIVTHLSGSRHQKALCSKHALNSFEAYHNCFLKLDPKFQAHQFFFVPCTTQLVTCNLCECNLDYDLLQEHIEGNGHKTAYFKYLGSYVSSPLLFPLQGSVYPKEATAVLDVNGKTMTNPYARSRVRVNTDTADSDTDRSMSPAKLPPANGVAKQKKAEKVPVRKQTHNIIKSILNPNKPLVTDSLDSRFSVHLKVLVQIGNKVDCRGCNVAIPAKLKEVKQHIISVSHCTVSGILTPKYQFYCDVCAVLFNNEDSWSKHMLLPTHAKRCESLSVARQAKLTEYDCKTCKIVIFGDELSVKRHEMGSKDRSLSRGKNEVKLPKEVVVLFRTDNQIEHLACRLVTEANAVLESTEPLKECCKALENAIEEVYSSCKAHPFGSRVSGLGNKDSDLDLFLDLGDMYMGEDEQDSKSQEKFVKNCAKALQAKKEVFSHINPISGARTPIIQVYHIATKLDCDLSFRNGLSVENTKYLSLCFSLQPIVQKLILVLKQWCVKCHLHEHITTYALSMMAIFYMQLKGYLPSVVALKKINTPLIIDGWESPNFTPDLVKAIPRIPQYNLPLKNLLREFFGYYASFDYTQDIICPLLGYPVKKILFEGNPRLLPPEMRGYVIKLIATPEPEYFRSRAPFGIQDPFDLCHNLTKAAGFATIENLKILCSLTYKHIQSIP